MYDRFEALTVREMTPVRAAHAAGVRYRWGGSWVMEGTHKPATVGTDREATFQLKNGVAVHGGFAGTETRRTQRHPATHVTILSGDIDGNDSQKPIISNLATVTGNGPNSYHVLTGVTGATLDGFTITAGFAGGASPGDCGGDMYNSRSNPTLTDVAFRGNSATYAGGGMYNWSSNPAISNTILWGNAAVTGTQIYNETSTPVVSYSVVAGGYAGGASIVTADPSLGALGSYGGGTQTIPLLPGSSAIDTANDAVCPATDRRGVPRPQGAHGDIGAYELDRYSIYLPLTMSGR
jgi:hypothetical protein